MARISATAPAHLRSTSRESDVRTANATHRHNDAQTAKPSVMRETNGFAFVPKPCRVLGQHRRAVEPAVLRPRFAPGDRSNVISIAPARFALNGNLNKATTRSTGPHPPDGGFREEFNFREVSIGFSEEWRARRDSNSRLSDSRSPNNMPPPHYLAKHNEPWRVYEGGAVYSGRKTGPVSYRRSQHDRDRDCYHRDADG